MIDQETTKITTTKKTYITKTKIIETMSTKLITDKDLSTDIAADATNDIKAVTPKSVVDYVTAQSGITVDKTGGEGFTKVGINNETPGVALDIVGDIKFIPTNFDSGNIYLGNYTGLPNVAGLYCNNADNIIAEFDIPNQSYNYANGNLNVNEFGLMKIKLYGSGTLIGTPTHNLQVDASGNVIEGTGFTGDVVAGQTMTFENGILKTVV